MDLLKDTNFSHLGKPRRGKVRDVYDLGQYLFIVVTDRLSAFDVVLPDIIPRKGIILNQVSLYWFKMMQDVIANHIVAATYEECPAEVQVGLKAMRDLLAGRSVLVRKAERLPVECIVRGYLAGSAWKEYQKSGTVCRIELPQGLVESARLPEPLFTPSTKAEEGHDVNVSYEQMILVLADYFAKNPKEPDAARHTAQKIAAELKAKSLAIYRRGCEHAEKKGIIIADTKFEFGILDGELILIDEILTPDSSRFWPMEEYQPGRSQNSFDKQIVRDYLLTLDWNQTYPGPNLPVEIIEKVAKRYAEIWQRLTS